MSANTAHKIPTATPVRPSPTRRGPVTLLLILTLGCLSLPLLSFAAVGWFSRYAADDYCTASQVALAGLVQAQSHLYVNWSGRFSATLFNTLLETIGVGAVPLLAGVALLAWGASLAWAIRELARPFGWRLSTLASATLAALLVFASLDTSADTPQDVYWQTGLVTYLLPLILATLLVGWIARHASAPPSVSPPLERGEPFVQAPLERGEPVTEAPLKRGEAVAQAQLIRDDPAEAPLRRGEPVAQVPCDRGEPVTEAPLKRGDPVPQAQLTRGDPAEAPLKRGDPVAEAQLMRGGPAEAPLRRGEPVAQVPFDRGEPVTRALLILGVPFALALLAGGTSETFAAAQLTALVVALATTLVLGSRARGMLLGALLGAALALVILALAPGNDVRQDTAARTPLQVALPEAVDFMRGWLRLTFARPHAIALALLVAVPALVAVFSTRSMSFIASPLAVGSHVADARGLAPRPVIAIAAVLIGVALIVLACILPAFYALGSNPPGRAQLIPENVVLSGVGLLGWTLGALAAEPIRAALRQPVVAGLSAFIVLALLALGPLLAARQTLAQLSAASAYATNWDRLDTQIRADRNRGVESVRVPPLASTGSIQNLDWLGPDPTDWFNQCVAGYYGVTSIAATPAS